MSSQELIGESGDCGWQSSESEAEDYISSHKQDKPKPLDKCFDCWTLKDIVQADILNIDFNERKQQLIEHFQTRTAPKRPASVKSLVIFANLHEYINAEPEEIQTISIEIIGYVQTNRSRNCQKVDDDELDTVRDLGARPRRLVQQQRLSSRHGSRKQRENVLVYAAHIRRAGVEQSRPFRSETRAKGIRSIVLCPAYFSQISILLSW